MSGFSERLWRHRLAVGAGFCALVALGAAVAYVALSDGGPVIADAPDLRAHVRATPPVPVAFVSRTEPASLAAPAPEGEGFAYPGALPWAAREGRLRLLDTDGKVYELTWGRALPDGGTLIDAMSPSISLDGKRVLFAGRRAAPDHGRWRIYEVGVDGSNLRQLTGGPNDEGCGAVPPMRFAADGTRLDDATRRRVDYDDVDPIDQGSSLVFASSRTPDLGRDHARRATQLWLWPTGEAKPHPITSNRNNDRWPFLTLAEDLIVFSMWSRNREAVTADGTDVRPVSSGGAFATAPTDQWVGMRLHSVSDQFGFTVKIEEPVWRQRPLFNGRLAFFTAHPAGGGRFRLAQADWGYLRFGGSSIAAGQRMPKQQGGALLYGPERDADGRDLSAACPTPCPTGAVLFAAAPVGAPAGAWALYTASDDWAAPAVPAVLFDDPARADTDPVAVYARAPAPAETTLPMTGAPLKYPGFKLANGAAYDGPFGELHNSMIRVPAPDPFLGQKTDTGAGPVVPPPTGVKSVVFYAAHRDRFDDPNVPRVPGGWEKLSASPLDQGGQMRAKVPALPHSTTVLAGLGEDGTVFKWTATTPDSAGRSATFYALAGDHYSGTRPNGYHFCLGCHTGHTFIPADVRERVQK